MFKQTPLRSIITVFAIGLFFLSLPIDIRAAEENVSRVTMGLSRDKDSKQATAYKEDSLGDAIGLDIARTVMDSKRGKKISSPLAKPSAESAPKDEPKVTSKIESDALHKAAQAGDLAKMKQLISEGVPLDGVANIDGMADVTALHIAALYDQVDAAKLLIDSGADIEVKAYMGFTPLHTAAYEGNTDMVTLLLDNGADKTAETEHSQTAQDIAIDLGSRSLITLLQEDKVDERDYSSDIEPEITTPAPAETTKSTAAAKTSDRLTDLVPAEAIFCVRINNLDSSLEKLDKFLYEVTPVPVSTSMLVKMQLAKRLGSGELTGVNTRGSLVFFGMMLPEELSVADNENPFANVFTATLIPVTNYKKFIAENPQCSAADSDGVSRITVAQTEQSGGTDIGLIATPGNKYALVTGAKNSNLLPDIVSLMSGSSLSEVLDEKQQKQAKSSPVWTYVNVANASEIAPAIFSGGQMGMIMGAMQANAGAQGDAQAKALNRNIEMMKMLAEDTGSLSISINPKPTELMIETYLAATPGTEMANTLSGISTGADNDILSYAEDKAFMTFAANIDKDSSIRLNAKGIELLSAISEEPISDDDIERLKSLASDIVSSMAGPIVSSTVIVADKKPPIAGNYIIKLSDPEKFSESLEKILAMMENGEFDFVSKLMDVETSYEVRRDVEEYHGFSVSSSLMKMHSEDPSPHGQAVNTIYENPVDYQWTIVGDKFLCYYGENAKLELHNLIKMAESGEANELTPELQKTTKMMGDLSEAHFVITYNYVRAIHMAGLMGLKAPVPGAGEISLPQIDVPTENNLNIIGNISDGSVDVKIGLSKDHLKELVSAFTQLQQYMMQQIMSQQQQNVPQQP
ncbi:MAG: ankyrin repeat domain-containing protein [Sedimentisphaerales bacterium]|nr:ankyrin repeat domain-containing protein [Sedimentisphaerales bacterium]